MPKCIIKETQGHWKATAMLQVKAFPGTPAAEIRKEILLLCTERNVSLELCAVQQKPQG